MYCWCWIEKYPERKQIPREIWTLLLADLLILQIARWIQADWTTWAKRLLSILWCSIRLQLGTIAPERLHNLEAFHKNPKIFQCRLDKRRLSQIPKVQYWDDLLDQCRQSKSIGCQSACMERWWLEKSTLFVLSSFCSTEELASWDWADKGCFVWFRGCSILWIKEQEWRWLY